MEFNKGKKKKKISFDDAPSRYWLHEEKQWDDLKHKVDEDVKDDQSRRFGRFAKTDSAFDKPNDEDLRKVEVNVKLSLPKIDVARFKFLAPLLHKARNLKKYANTAQLKKLSRKHYIIASASLLLIIAGIVVGNKYFFNDKPQAGEVAGTNNQGSSEVTTPTNDPKFSIIKPQGREIPKEKIIYDSKRNFTKFDDEINGVPITVSQQPMPDAFKADPKAGAAKIAKNFGTTDSFMFDDIELNYGQDEKGPQTMIFTKKDLLIFIMTSQQVDKEGLKVYAGNLD